MTCNRKRFSIKIENGINEYYMNISERKVLKLIKMYKSNKFEIYENGNVIDLAKYPRIKSIIDENNLW